MARSRRAFDAEEDDRFGLQLGEQCLGVEVIQALGLVRRDEVRRELGAVAPGDARVTIECLLPAPRRFPIATFSRLP